MRKFFGKKYLLHKLYDNGEGVRVRYPQRKKSWLWRSAGYCCPRYTRRGYKKNKQGIKADKSGFCHGGNRGNRWRVRKSSIFGSRENDVFEASKRCPFYFGQLLARAKNDRRDEDQAHSTRGAFIELAGIQPHIILARSEYALDEPRKKKVSIYCNIAPNDVISAPDVESIYEVPLNFEKENLGKRILAKFEMRGKGKNLEAWEKLVNTIQTSENPVKLGIVGKYFESGAFTLSDSYISVIEALKHACWFHKRKPEISWLNSDHYEKFPESLSELKDFDGIIVPGGFGSRGVEGKIMAAGFCRSNNIPYLGLCYGMQIATIEFARTVCKLDGANTSEIDKKTPHPVIDVMPEQKTNIQKKDYGASMRLGAYNCLVKRGSVAHRAYSKGDFEKEKEKNGDLIISERHRHRYELNNNYRESLEKEGLLMSGINPERNLVEIIELPNHKFFVGTQFHPEFKSRPLRPHPLFVEFIRAAIS